MNEKQITIIKEDGTETLCDILFTYYSEEFNKNYILFAEQGSDEVGAASYEVDEANKEGGSLQQIQTDAEWQMLEELLENYTNQLDGQSDEEPKDHECSGCGGGCHSEKSDDEGCCGN